MKSLSPIKMKVQRKNKLNNTKMLKFIESPILPIHLSALRLFSSARDKAPLFHRSKLEQNLIFLCNCSPPCNSKLPNIHNQQCQIRWRQMNFLIWLHRSSQEVSRMRNRPSFHFNRPAHQGSRPGRSGGQPQRGPYTTVFTFDPFSHVL